MKNWKYDREDGKERERMNRRMERKERKNEEELGRRR
jgi:hypothetical protein